MTKAHPDFHHLQSTTTNPASDGPLQQPEPTDNDTFNMPIDNPANDRLEDWETFAQSGADVQGIVDGLFGSGKGTGPAVDGRVRETLPEEAIKYHPTAGLCWFLNIL